jgi:hypothetical protein
MRYLLLLVVISIFGLSTPLSAQICCPAGCVQDSNRCVTTGPNPRTCNSVPCSGTPSGSSGGSGRDTYVVPSGPFPSASCLEVNPTPASRAAATNQCVAALTANAQLWGCWFEDDAGRAEDQRTGLSCADRQKALANQCQARCASFAATQRACLDRSAYWQAVFGDIGGQMYGSARVDLCGPRLPTKRHKPSVSDRIRPFP